MRGSAISSGILHLGVVIAMVIGLPDFGRELEVAPPIPVEIVNIDEITRPKPAEKPQPTPAPEPPKEIPEAPEPPQQRASAPPPPPPLEAPQQEARLPEPPEPEPAPEPEPEVVPEPEPQPEPKPEVEKKEPEPAPEPPAPRPQQKPKVKLADKPKKEEPKVDRLASILKNVEKLQEEGPSRQRAKPKPQALPQQSALSDQPMSLSEIDAIRRQIERCWTPPVGARDAENLIIDIQVNLGPDGRVLNTEALDRGRMARDPFFRVAAESALRAVRRCSPLEVPLKKYSVWKDLTLTFNPREMLGQ